MNDQEIFFKSLLDGNRRMGSEIATKYSENHQSIKYFYDSIVKPSLYKIGELWEYNLITVAAEHMATSVSESVMNDLYEYVINENRQKKKVVLGCIENEYHQVGIKMIADIFEMNGWDTYFLGSNVPNTEFFDFLKEIKPDIIAISLSIYSHINSLEKLLKLCREEFNNTPIIIGGQAFVHGGDEVVDKFDNIKLFKTLESLELFIKNFN